MSADSGASEAALIIILCSCLLILPACSSSSPQFQNDNRPVALLLPNGNIVPSRNIPECDPHDQKPTLPVINPSKESIGSRLSSSFSNRRKKGFAEQQSRVHPNNNTPWNNNVPFKPGRHPQPLWGDFPRAAPQSWGSQQSPTDFHHRNSPCHFGSPQSLYKEKQFSSIVNFSNRRKKGFAEFQSRVHPNNNTPCNNIPLRPGRHAQPIPFQSDLSCIAPQYWGNQQNSKDFLHQNSPALCGSPLNRYKEKPFSSITDEPCGLTGAPEDQKTCCTELTSGRWLPEFQNIPDVAETSKDYSPGLSLKNDEGYQSSEKRKGTLQNRAPRMSESRTQHSEIYEGISHLTFPKRQSDSYSTPGNPFETESAASQQQGTVLLQFPEQHTYVSMSGNYFPKQAGALPLQLFGNKSMFSIPTNILPLRTAALPWELIHRHSPIAPPKAPWSTPWDHCPLLSPPWIPKDPAMLGQGAPWCPPMNLPWNPVPSSIPGPLIQPQEPPAPDLMIFGNYGCPFMGLFVPAGPSVPHATLMQEVLLEPDYQSSTTAFSFFPLEQLNIVELLDFFDLPPWPTLSYGQLHFL